MRRFALLAALFTVAACAQPGHPPAVTPETVQQDSTPERTKITAAQLLGKSDAWVIEQMGEPHFKRADMLANLWQYKNSQCVLNLFLYADEKTHAAPYQVLHFDARDPKGRSTDRAVCLNDLQN